MKSLDYSFLECAKYMPPLTNSQTENFDIRSSEAAKWIMQQPEVMKKIFNKAVQHGFIKFNPETKTWQGVDYGN